MLSLLSICSVAISLFLFCCISLFYFHLERYFDASHGSLQMSVYLKDGTEPKEVQEIVQWLQSSPNIWTVDYVDKQQALVFFRERMADESSLLDGINAKNNPLPASLEVTLRSSSNPKSVFPELEESLAERSVVELVDYPQQLVDRFDSIHKVARFVVLFLMAAVLFVSAWGVGSMVGLSLFSRRTELEVFNFCGAAPRMIELPFIFEGAFHGVIGSVVALLLFHVAFFLFSQVEIVNEFGSQFSSLPGWFQILLVLIGALTGAMGSYAALRRFLLYK